jgi:hypothetical protein
MFPKSYNSLPAAARTGAPHACAAEQYAPEFCAMLEAWTFL